MRRWIFLLVLVILLAISIVVSRLVSDWHYVLPAEAGKVVYLATFDGFNEDWNQAQGRLRTQILDTGVLRLDVGDTNSIPFSEAKQHFGDFELRVQATPIDGPLNNGYGVIFRLQTKNNNAPGDNDFYLFMISSDGYYQVSRSINGQQKVLSLWIPSDVVQQGIGVMNSLRVVAKGDRFQFYINNQLVSLCIPDDPEAESTYNQFTDECVGGQMLDTLIDSSIPSGQIGVVAQTFDESGVVVDFDNLVVYGPE